MNWNQEGTVPTEILAPLRSPKERKETAIEDEGLDSSFGLLNNGEQWARGKLIAAVEACGRGN
ncbi:hypothetical protein DSO57_1033449 [Entomophthora muscae]|uniref:Uncharacterized protein n=1 Tax=Entomophthora muscae TaxID=34485 RepID=A0ACC2RR42_9FUNG|nr:hypothetical protein DSO57_1033449 [Entomophthora muscae]